MRGIKVTRSSPATTAPEPLTLRPLCELPEIVAHTPTSAGSPWHLLSAHLLSVGDLAQEFAAPFGGAQLTQLAGYLHDAGKATDDVQRRFRELGAGDGRRREPLGVPHKQEGALLMAALFSEQRAPLALAGYLMNYGHHTGIPAKDAAQASVDVRGAWRHPGLLDPYVRRMSTLLGRDLESLARSTTVPERVVAAGEQGDWTALDLFTRMCHSAVVDADFLDTAAHFHGQPAANRARSFGMPRWLDQFSSFYAQRFGAAEPSELNAVRTQVFDACVRSALADLPRGIYRLPAPTGTGKTMASAAFALHHAVRWGKRRVIVAVPFTTITTQNAAAYREAFGPELAPEILEHHSNLLDDDIADETWLRLSATSWDAEFIVTTTVQLFESLFDNRPSQTRKLHRLADSVLVLDEIQALPIDLLGQVLGILRELVEHFGVTVLLASATQPTFWSLSVWDGLPVHDILAPGSLPDVTQRVTYEVRASEQPRAAIAAEAAREHQVLMIENRRADADALYLAVVEARDSDDTYLLSKSMTADHRERVLTIVRDRLASGQSVAVVSTQLIEAGVDIDFPVVFRSVGPAEAVIQAAGRCNREGRLGSRGGRVVVYAPTQGEAQPPPGVYAGQTGITRDLFLDKSHSWSFDSEHSMAHYFGEVWRSTRGAREERDRLLGGHRRSLNFPDLAKGFRMIEEMSVDVVVVDHPDEAIAQAISNAVDSLAAHPLNPIPHAMRRLLQRHSASVSRKDRHLSDELGQGIRVWSGRYDPRRGVISDHALTW